MSRSLRIKYPGAYYHIMTRGLKKYSSTSSAYREMKGRIQKELRFARMGREVEALKSQKQTLRRLLQGQEKTETVRCSSRESNGGGGGNRTPVRKRPAKKHRMTR